MNGYKRRFVATQKGNFGTVRFEVFALNRSGARVLAERRMVQQFGTVQVRSMKIVEAKQ